MGHVLYLTKNELYNKGFRYNKLMSDDIIDCYSIRFPVYKYKRMTVLECELVVELQTCRVITNVYNYGTNDVYLPYYNREYGNYPILDSINAAIRAQYKKLGVKEKK